MDGLFAVLQSNLNVVALVGGLVLILVLGVAFIVMRARKNAAGPVEQKKNIPAPPMEERPSNNLNDLPRRDMIAARLGENFLAPEDTEQTDA